MHKGCQSSLGLFSTINIAENFYIMHVHDDMSLIVQKRGRGIVEMRRAMEGTMTEYEVGTAMCAPVVVAGPEHEQCICMLTIQDKCV